MWISQGLRTFWEKVIVLKLAAMGLSKQYCLRRSLRRRVVLRGQAEKQESQNVLQP